MWITTAKDGFIMTLGRDSGHNSHNFVFSVSNGYLSFWDYNNGYGFNTACQTQLVNTGARTHVAFAKSGSTGIYYINGNPTCTVTSSLSSTSYTNVALCVGKDCRNNNNFFTGKMDSIQIFSAQLSASQIHYLGGRLHSLPIHISIQ